MNLFAKTLSIAALSALAVSCSSTPKASSPTNAAAPTAAPSPAPAEKPKAATAASPLELKCELKGDTRVITVVPGNGGCDLHYLKAGKSEVVASSTKGTEHCDQVRAKMRKNLEDAGFQCK